MAIEKKIPRDISRYEAKLIGPFTTRQICFGVPGILLGIGAFLLLKQYLTSDVNFFVSASVALPFLCCAAVKPYGIPFEKYVSIVFVSQFLAPKHRKYKTELQESETTNTVQYKKKTTRRRSKSSIRSSV